MKRLCLFNLEQAGLILLLPTGVTLFNLSGGADAVQREAEGCFVPLGNDPMVDAEADEYLHRQLASACGARLDIASADRLDVVLRQVSSSDLIRVDRQRLAESASGWVYVLADSQGEFSQFEGFGRCAAVLTWPNSLNT